LIAQGFKQQSTVVKALEQAGCDRIPKGTSNGAESSKFKPSGSRYIYAWHFTKLTPPENETPEGFSVRRKKTWKKSYAVKKTKTPWHFPNEW